jgi:hypothetical protein
LSDGPQWVQLDLGEEMAIHVVWIWHRSGMDTMVFHDVIVEICNDPTFKDGVVQVFNNDYNNSSKRGRGTNRPYTESRYGKPIQANGVTGRYIRCYSNGSSWRAMNSYIEIEVFGHAANKGVARELVSPVDPMSSSFRSFEKHFWEEASKRRLVNGNSDGLDLKGEDELIILMFRQHNSKLTGEPLRKTTEWLNELMLLANECWNQYHPTVPLRNIEVHTNAGQLLHSLNPGGKED